MLKDLFVAKKCFKLVCGAGNEDAAEVEKLVALYSLAGCNFFDLCAGNHKVYKPFGKAIKEIREKVHF